jgi:acetyltransferase-like isoleucine patch superfamily enzyme
VDEMKQLIYFIQMLKNYIIRKIIGPIKYARRIGVKVGNNCRLVGNVKFGSEPYLITLGDHVSITTSQFITHDGGVWVFREKHPDIDVVAPIKVGNNVFIGAGCTILPGVEIGNNVVVGAGSLVTKSLPSDFVYGGIPAKPIKKLEDYWNGIEKKVIRTKGLSEKNKREFLENMFQSQQ